jgi:outer membrane protein
VDLAVPREELVGQALEKNPALRRSTRLVEEASEIEDRAVLSPWIPSLGIGGLWSERGENPGRFGGAEDYFASIGWEIKGFGLGTRAEVRAAEARHRLARLDLAEVRERLIAAIVRLRAELASQKEAIEASEAGITAARSAVEKTRARLEQGQGLVVEMLEAQAALARAQRTRLRAITGFNKSVFIQKTLLGKRPVP